MVSRLPWVLCAILSLVPFALSRHVWVNLTSRNRTVRAKLFRQSVSAEEPERWNETVLKVWMSGLFAIGGILMLVSGVYVAVTI